MLDLLELIYYVASFWFFIFNKKFRTGFIQKWKESSLFEKCFMSLEIVISFVCGVAIPILIIYFIVT